MVQHTTSLRNKRVGFLLLYRIFDQNYRIQWSKKPIALNFFNKILRFIVSKAFYGSIKIIPVSKHLLKPFTILLKRSKYIGQVISPGSRLVVIKIMLSDCELPIQWFLKLVAVTR